MVTSLARKRLKARALYEDFYCARGDMENRIKEQQLDLFADRTSAATMRANQLRLYLSSGRLHAPACVAPAGPEGNRHGAGPVPYDRLKLLKIGAPNPSDRPPRLDRDVGSLSLGRDPSPRSFATCNPSRSAVDDAAPRPPQNSIRFVTPAEVRLIPPEDAVSHPKMRLPRLRECLSLPSDASSRPVTLSQTIPRSQKTLKPQLVRQAG